MSKYLTYEERLEIQAGLNQNLSFGKIAKTICKDRTTIAKEIRRHLSEKKAGYSGWSYNACKYRNHCKVKDLCGKDECRRPSASFCKLCNYCNDVCQKFDEEILCGFVSYNM